MKNKTLQHFSKERLAQDAKLSVDEIARFLDEFASLAHGEEGDRKLISLRVPEKLLAVFKEKAKRNGVRYQTQIIDLIRQWVIGRAQETPARSRSRG